MEITSGNTSVNGTFQHIEQENKWIFETLEIQSTDLASETGLVIVNFFVKTMKWKYQPNTASNGLYRIFRFSQDMIRHPNFKTDTSHQSNYPAGKREGDRSATDPARAIVWFNCRTTMLRLKDEFSTFATSRTCVFRWDCKSGVGCRERDSGLWQAAAAAAGYVSQRNTTGLAAVGRLS